MSNNLVKCTVKLRHDNGSKKIIVWGNSLTDATARALKAENAPESAVIYAKVCPLTIYDIKRNIDETGSYFFSKKTMRFFRQTLGDFKVNRCGNDKFFISAPMPHGKTQRIYDPFTNKLEQI